MYVLDLFAGLRGWSEPFAERGHDVFTVEYDYSFDDIDLYRNIANITFDELATALEHKWGTGNYAPDIILASPPCTAFTTMTMGRNWTMDGEPRTPIAAMGRALVIKTTQLIAAFAPRYHIIENPRARLRTLPFAPVVGERRTVWYCHLGETRAKPTDLWGIFPPDLALPPICHNQRDEHPTDCCCRDHIAAVRGSRGGTQGGVPGDIAAKIPRELALAVCIAMEDAA